jgi:single-strand DNA-binding protein
MWFVRLIGFFLVRSKGATTMGFFDDLNLAVYTGRVAMEPTMRYTQAGMAILNLRVASNRSVKAGDNFEQRTEWFPTVVFGKYAEGLQQHIKIGSRVEVQALVQTREWTDDAGQRHWRTEFIANNLTVHNERNGNGNGGSNTVRATGMADDVPQADIDQVFETPSARTQPLANNELF